MGCWVEAKLKGLNMRLLGLEDWYDKYGQELEDNEDIITKYEEYVSEAGDRAYEQYRNEQLMENIDG